ncbi:uncharacterized protein LY79DRAFT_367444 [Colletotrichum navitas]|uniref:Uncharacterized protein n=1 Tax=Colletotrichum navitas TaxID=681940 RepID=A0AAD8PQP5_9PEZI|nr:uncharacterized protein LY79DRAFT_367444 [Colletotrichum navitas]KAK1574487.1 hypothetical protein LY79DRAFT_367444 [Colletotrichum navitas]
MKRDRGRATQCKDNDNNGVGEVVDEDSYLLVSMGEMGGKRFGGRWLFSQPNERGGGEPSIRRTGGGEGAAPRQGPKGAD